MIDIINLRSYFENDEVLISDHVAMRFRQKGLKVKNIRFVVNNGEIIEQYPDDYPFPSCLILGKTIDGKYIHVVMSDEGKMSKVITAYYPDPNKWDDQLKVRKEN